MQSTEQARVREYSEKIGNDKEGSALVATIRKESINGVETWTGWTTNEFESLGYKSIEKLAKAKKELLITILQQ